jgi:allantoicase
MKDFLQLADLASERFGGEVLEANDEFFGPKENLVKVSKPIFIEGKYTPRGKWMDGWETRRRRTPGYDWCIIRLGLAGMIRGVAVDTSYFTGNFPSHCSLEGCDLGAAAPYKNERKRLQAPALRWVELLPQTALAGDSLNQFAIEHPGRFTHVRLKIYPDGGVARLRVHGEAVPEKARVSRGEFDLAGVENGGNVVASSDQFYSAPLNLLMPGGSKDMSDGWETRRRRGPGNDWVIVKLAVPGVVRRIQVDTSHFKGNYPDSCSVESCYLERSAGAAADSAWPAWKQLLPQSKLKANRRHIFRRELQNFTPCTHVRFNIFPDGGVSRLRIFGRAERASDRLAGIERFNQDSAAHAGKALLDCCASKKWAELILKQRPFESAAQLLEASDKAWASLPRKEWLAAFRHHPAIGGAQGRARQSETARRWSAGEQSVAQRASRETLAVLAAANQAYHAAFGHVFLICAQGKTSEEILKNLQQRLSNDPEVELRNAAEEQRKITRLRLEKLLAS